MIHTQKQTGFTVVELAISTAVFSTVLLLVTFGLIQIGRAFTKSVNEGRTQEATRNITDEVATTIKFNGEDVKELTPITGAGGVRIEGYCVGRKRYSYILNRQLGNQPGQLPHIFVTEFMEESCTKSTTPRNITAAIPAGTRAIEMLYPNMQLNKFNIDEATEANYFNLNVRVISGADIDFMNDPTDPDPTNPRRICNPNNVGSTQFCAFSELSTTAQKRVQ